MINAISIYLDRVEGKRDELIDITLTGENLWERADETLNAWRKSVRGESNKVDFRITFADGEIYGGTYDLERDKTPSLAAHILSYLEFYGGLCEQLPPHFTPGTYQNFITGLPPEKVQSCKNFLSTYQIGKAPTIEFWATTYRVLAPIPRWRGGVTVIELYTHGRGTEYAVRTNDGRSLSKDGEWHNDPLTLDADWLNEHRWQDLNSARKAATTIAEMILECHSP